VAAAKTQPCVSTVRVEQPCFWRRQRICAGTWYLMWLRSTSTRVNQSFFAHRPNEMCAEPPISGFRLFFTSRPTTASHGKKSLFIITNQLSGLGWVVGPVCVSVSVCLIFVSVSIVRMKRPLTHHCVECPQYCIRLEAPGCLCTSCLLSSFDEA